MRLLKITLADLDVSNRRLVAAEAELRAARLDAAILEVRELIIEATP